MPHPAGHARVNWNDVDESTQEKDDKRLTTSIEKELIHDVEDLIRESEGLLTGHPKQVELLTYRNRAL